MICINLLPYRPALRLKLLQKILAAWGATAIVGAIICLGIQSYMEGLVEEQEAIKTQNEEQIKKLKDELGSINDLNKIKTDLQKRLDVIATLSKNRDLPVRVMNELSLAIPMKIWLLNLEVKPERVSLSGFSDSNAEIANFMINLGKSPLFNSVELGKSTDELVKGLSLKSFEITFTIKPPA